VRDRHPRKEVEEALQDAEEAGFKVITGRAHWGLLQCPGKPPDACKTMSISGTPRNPGAHAKQLRRFVVRCPHKKTADG